MDSGRRRIREDRRRKLAANLFSLIWGMIGWNHSENKGVAGGAAGIGDAERYQTMRLPGKTFNLRR